MVLRLETKNQVKSPNGLFSCILFDVFRFYSVDKTFKTFVYCPIIMKLKFKLK